MIVEDKVIEEDTDNTGITIIETITTTTTTTTVTNQDSGDLLNGNNDLFIHPKKVIMDIDCGQGPASMPSGTLVMD